MFINFLLLSIMKKHIIKKTIKINKNKFYLEIYPRIVSWEIFPADHNAALYAFSNKEKLELSQLHIAVVTLSQSSYLNASDIFNALVLARPLSIKDKAI